MIQYRRFSALLLGLWLGAAIVTDIVVTQNFQTVDRFLNAPGSLVTSIRLNEMSAVTGREKLRMMLRRNAAEENNSIFETWERVELLLGAALLGLLIFGERPQVLMLALCAGMIAIVLGERFFLTPEITDLGRRIDDLPPGDPVSKRFWLLHGVYSGVDLLKMALGFALAARTVFRRKTDTEMFAREYAAHTAKATARG